MKDAEKDRLIVEALGECWHEWDTQEEWYRCIKCSGDVRDVYIPRLATTGGFFWWWPRLQKMPFWEAFLSAHGNFVKPAKVYAMGFNPGMTRIDEVQVNIIHEVRGRDALAEWLEANPEAWKGGKMKITVAFWVISDPPMPEEDMRSEFLFNLKWFIGIIPTVRGAPVVEVTGFKLVSKEGE